MIQRPPRLTGNPQVDINAVISWAFGLYSTLAGLNFEARLEALDKVEKLTLTVSNPPTQVEMQKVVDKMNEILVAAKQPVTES